MNYLNYLNILEIYFSITRMNFDGKFILQTLNSSLESKILTSELVPKLFASLKL